MSPRRRCARFFAMLSAAVLAFAVSSGPAAAQNPGRATADGKAGVSGDAVAAPVAAPAGKTGSTSCSGGSAAGFSCSGIDLVSFMPRAGLGAASNIRLNDIWGWTDPADGREYALVGREDGVAFVDISTPASPRYVGELLLHPGSVQQVWRDFKVFDNHLFVVADGSGSRAHGMQVFDLTRLRAAQGEPVSFPEDAHYAEVGSAHNIAINEASGYAFIVGFSSTDRCGTGLHMVDISSPTAPAFAGCFRDGASTSGYSHDVQCVTYHGPDVRYSGREICVGSNVDAVVVADVTDKQNPVTLGAGQYPQSSYIHQGWFTGDHRYFVQDDELDERSYGHGARTRIWDMAELDDPVLTATYESHLPAIDHNLFVRDDKVYAANYASGLRVLSIADVQAPREIAWFDTHPVNDETNFNGAWGSYPFFESGNVIVSSRDEGLFVVRLHDVLHVSVSDVSVDVRPSDGQSGSGLSDAHVSFEVTGEDVLDRLEIGVQGHPAAEALEESAAAGKSVFGAVLTGLSGGIHVIDITAVGKDGTRAVVGSASIDIIPETHTLSPAVPNPAAERVGVVLAVREAQTVRAVLFDTAGREVSTVFESEMQAGAGVQIDVDVSSVPSGVYFLRVTGRDFSETRRVVVID